MYEYSTQQRRNRDPPRHGKWTPICAFRLEAHHPMCVKRIFRLKLKLIIEVLLSLSNGFYSNREQGPFSRAAFRYREMRSGNCMGRRPCRWVANEGSLRISCRYQGPISPVGEYFESLRGFRCWRVMFLNVGVGPLYSRALSEINHLRSTYGIPLIA